MGWGEWGDLPEYWYAVGTTEGEYTDVYSAVAMMQAGCGVWESNQQKWLYYFYINGIGAVRFKQNAPTLGNEGWGCGRYRLLVRKVWNSTNLYFLIPEDVPGHVGSVPHIGEEGDYSSVEYILIFLAEQAIGLISAPVAFLWDAAELVANLTNGIDEEDLDTDLVAVFNYPCDDNFIGNWPTDCSFWYWWYILVNPNQRIRFNVDTIFSSVERMQLSSHIEHSHTFTIISKPPNPETLSVDERETYDIEEISAEEIENYISKYSLPSGKIRELKEKGGKIYLTRSGITVDSK